MNAEVFMSDAVVICCVVAFVLPPAVFASVNACVTGLVVTGTGGFVFVTAVVTAVDVGFTTAVTVFVALLALVNAVVTADNFFDVLVVVEAVDDVDDDDCCVGGFIELTAGRLFF